MAKLCGHQPEAFLPFEIGPNNFREMLTCAEDGLPLLDADVAGYRAVPEISLSSFNIHDVPAQPALFASAWGDIITVERVVSWQRLVTSPCHLAVVSVVGCAADGLRRCNRAR